MKAEGIQLPFKQPPKPRLPVDDTDDEEDEDEGADEQPPKKEDDANKDKKADTDEPKGDEDKGDKSKDENQKDGKDKRLPRRQVMIPVARVNQRIKETRQQVEAEYSGKITDLTNQVTTLQEQLNKGNGSQQKVDTSVEKLTQVATEIAEKHNSDPELVKDILSSFQQLNKAGVEIPAELKDAIERIRKFDADHKEREETDAILNQYQDEFQKEIAGNADLVNEIRASGLTLDEFKERLQELVLGEDGGRYAKLSLSEVLAMRRADLLPAKKKSADSSRQRTVTGQSEADPDNFRMLSAEEINAMTPEEFQKYSDDLGKNQKSRITRRGQPIN